MPDRIDKDDTVTLRTPQIARTDHEIFGMFYIAILFDAEVVCTAGKHHDDAAYLRGRSVVENALEAAIFKGQVAHEDASLQ
jgi:hypothetical protein